MLNHAFLGLVCVFSRSSPGAPRGRHVVFVSDEGGTLPSDVVRYDDGYYARDGSHAARIARTGYGHEGNSRVLCTKDSKTSLGLP